MPPECPSSTLQRRCPALSCSRSTSFASLASSEKSSKAGLIVIHIQLIASSSVFAGLAQFHFLWNNRLYKLSTPSKVSRQTDSLTDCALSTVFPLLVLSQPKHCHNFPPCLDSQLLLNAGGYHWRGSRSNARTCTILPFFIFLS